MSNEITITIPLSLLSGVESLTPEGISTALNDLTLLKESEQAARRSVTAIANDARRIGQGMQAVLDGDNNIMDKFKALREYASKAQQLGGLYA